MDNNVDARMHTAEHILNQTMDRLFDCGRCFNAHIGKKKSKCDYRFERPLAEGEVRTIESKVNAVIGRALAITETWVPLSEAKGVYPLDKLPANIGDTIRIVNVGDYDACPCIGAHVSTSDDVGRFRITTTSFDAGVLRIRFKLS